MITVNGKVYDGVAVKPDLDEALEHYGVKGMKWRRRKGKSFINKVLNYQSSHDADGNPIRNAKNNEEKEKAIKKKTKRSSIINKILNYNSSHDSEGNPVNRNTNTNKQKKSGTINKIFNYESSHDSEGNPIKKKKKK